MRPFPASRAVLPLLLGLLLAPLAAEPRSLAEIALPVYRGEEAFRARIAARSAGREPLGLVLSGGSARAFAHIGVLRALEEEGIVPDYIVADSMGAIVAALYAGGLDPAAILELVAGMPVSRLLDPVLPTKGGFLDQGRFIALARSLLGGMDLSGTPIPLLVICEDLRSRREVRLAEGDAALVTTAAFALPAAMEPVEFEGMLLIDGGITNLVPVEAATRYGGRVIAATAFYDRDMDFRNPFVVLNRAIDIGKTRAAVEEIAALAPFVVRCEVEGLSYMEFSRPREIEALGYRSARGVIEGLRAFAGAGGFGGPDPDLLALRMRRRAAVDALVRGAARGDVLDDEPGFALVVAARLADEAEGGRRGLEGRRFAGLEGRLGGRRAEAGIALLAGLDAAGEPGAGLRLRGSLAPGGPAVLAAEASLWSAGPGAVEGLGLDAAFSASTGLGPLSGAYLRPWLRGELAAALSSSLDPGTWELEAGLGLEAGRRGGHRGFLGLGAYLDGEGNAGPLALARTVLALPADLEFRARASGRASLAGPGLGLRAADGYRGPETAEEPGPSALAGAAGLELALGLELFEGGLGELLAFEDSELSLWCDASVADAASAPRLAAGLSLATSLSPLGLAPLEFSVFAGMALDGSGWKAGLRGGRLFP